MRYRGAGGTRRWRSAIAVLAALGVFAAVVTGWAARGSAVPGAAALPQLAAQSQQAHATSPNEGAAAPGLRGDAPVHQKLSKHAWMTRERPPTWPRLAPHAVSPLPTSLAAAGVPPGDAHRGPPESAFVARDLLTHLCVARL